MRENRLNRRGFTLVELLVVIGIIALLIGILAPTLSRARQSSNNLYCLSNLRQLGVLTNFYANTYKGSLPLAIANTNPNVGQLTWGALLMTQVGVGEGVGTTNTNADEYRQRAILIDKDVYENKTALNHYSSHPLLVPNITLQYPAGHPLAAPGKFRVPYKLSGIRRAAEIILYFDGTQDLSAGGVGNANSDGYNLDANRFKATNPQTWLLTNSPSAAGVDMNASIDGGVNQDTPNNNQGGDSQLRIGNVRWRHLGNKSANAVFCDGHADSFFYGGQFQTGILRKNIHLDSNP
jgi:prepilin-type N-terminal cleavage/methylation domain-containing protein/prepilin-type processing-associated H-X9-DG protein